jgi:hypothetical protein
MNLVPTGLRAPPQQHKQVVQALLISLIITSRIQTRINIWTCNWQLDVSFRAYYLRHSYLGYIVYIYRIKIFTGIKACRFFSVYNNLAKSTVRAYSPASKAQLYLLCMHENILSFSLPLEWSTMPSHMRDKSYNIGFDFPFGSTRLAVEFVECLIVRRYSHGNCFNPSI